jgi:phosphoglycolate phosphatase-like HAD superfamily hydrolase
MIGARNNKVLGLGVLYGYGNKKELLDSGASYLIESPEDFANDIMQALPLRND